MPHTKYKHFVLPAFLLLATTLFARQTSPAQSTLKRPKLIVGIVVDQMRWDYLYRFYNRYGQAGFRRMLNEGFTCENTMISHLPTYTAIGHTSIYTGSVPAIHGIAGNDFINQQTGKTMYCAGDSTVQTVGSISPAGKMSPCNMLSSTITDELKLATNFRSKVIGIALKDRGGILPAGHVADAAYWLDDATGNWITSTFYMQELPAWVKAFNAGKQIQKYLSQDWNTLYPVNTYVQSDQDNSKYEGKFKGTDKPVFPVKLAEIEKTMGPALIRSTPFGNTLTLNMAKAAVDNEQMGQNTVTDFLAVSLSSTDYIGHQFGINSIEVEDTYLRLDRDLADFFNYLDVKLGKGNYTVFLSADHGGAHNPLFLQDHKLPGDLWNSGSCLKQINSILKEKYGRENLILTLINNQVHLNNTIIEQNRLDAEAIKNECIQFFQKQDGIAWAVDMEKIQTTSIPAAIKERIINGYNRQRSGIVQLILQTGWYTGTSKTGTTHGAWNPYDAHIPLVWMGWGIKHGKSNKQTYMTDIAPTIAALLNIQPPSGSIGKTIEEVLK
ncbi:alkaline phosphatase PafA [Pedobacter heparinus]|uniref:Type I phosphodiesterase/nucleotide pyrophosphatase n=1 Tax=Pedobacter heparinus (strain ATCC 13125 / DSM 2366 / CIP 104194 / JCM 7457 / NBRC 12017 / NCIMB 9290 / NRRL B-14731 / HIM 762-3) TaxID=485917 RepID=C6XT11_PEDHD|nr:alkaline phosphatase PafA [Pedobacter heparinus]ACU03572.1 type I phosphodiesterase/nucleotide pyrophosphatase [Pedobacter heparinus DSM 2366]